MTTALQQLQRLLDLLHSRGWNRSRETTRFLVYTPPSSTGDSGGYELIVPKDPAASDFARAVENCLAALGSFYKVPFLAVEEALLPLSEVVSLRFDGSNYHAGAAPFPQFERMIEHLKRSIARAAAFVVTDDPVTQSTPTAARRYLDDCWFMQTARGSFVTRVALPVTGDFRLPLSLFARPVEREAVVTTLRNLTALIGERVLSSDDSLYTESGFEAVRGDISVGVLEELAKLLRGAEASSMDISFRRGGEGRTVALHHLNDERMRYIETFISHVRERFLATFDLEAVGPVIEARRSRRRNSSLVGISAEVEGRRQVVSFKVEQEILPVFLRHFQSQQPIAVSGRARRLRTQIRIESNLSFEPA
jgi:hypothetical protein